MLCQLSYKDRSGVVQALRKTDYASLDTLIAVRTNRYPFAEIV